MPTVTIPVVADTYIDSGTPTTNHSAAASLITATPTMPTTKKILLTCNPAAALPANVHIESAKLKLYLTAALGPISQLSLHEVRSSAIINQCTWNDKFTGTPWPTAGGEYSLLAEDSITILLATGIYYEWDFTRLAKLYYWRTEELMMALIDNIPNEMRQFASMEAGANLPIIEITYTEIITEDTRDTIEDTYLWLTNPNSNYSTNLLTHAEYSLQRRRNTIIKMDPRSMITSGQVPKNVRLKLDAGGGGGTTGRTHRIELAEATRDDIVINQCTWNNYKTGSAWTAPGGDYGPRLNWLLRNVPDIAGYDYFDITSIFVAAHLSNSPLYIVLGIEPDPTSGDRQWRSMEESVAIRPIVQIDSVATEVQEIMNFTETDKNNMAVEDDDSLTLTESDVAGIGGTLDDSMTVTDPLISYITDYLAGIKGTIVTPLNLTADDYCAMIQDSGQVIYLNGVTERAHVFTKQTSQNFNIDVKILPGDAAMFTCPDLVVVVGDEVTWDGKVFRIAESINHYFANTIIYVKHALQRVRYTQPVPQVLGLVVSENLKGKTTLTWLEVDFPTFDHYEIWESVAGTFAAEAITGITPVGPGIALIQLADAYVPGKYIVGSTFSIEGSTGNDGDYTIYAYQDNAGKGELAVEVTRAMNATAPLGNVMNTSYYYKKDTTRSNGLTIKNLIPNSVYYYIVRAIDKYGNPGWWSNQEATPVNVTKPTKPEGLR